MKNIDKIIFLLIYNKKENILKNLKNYKNKILTDKFKDDILKTINVLKHKREAVNDEIFIRFRYRNFSDKDSII